MTEKQVRLKSIIDNCIKTSTGCLEYQGTIGNSGYARIRYKGRLISGGRAVLDLLGKNVPADKDVCHKCDNRKCLNHRHLFIGTRSENMRDCVKKGRQNLPVKEIKHGAQYAYWRKGCRCELCCAWKPTYPSRNKKKI